MMPNTITLTPKSGGEAFEVSHVMDFSWGANRSPAPNNYLGMDGHRLQTLTITRKVGLPVAGQAGQDYKISDLAAARGEKAYFEGEITHSRPDQPDNTMRVCRFAGHVISIQETWNEDDITQMVEMAVTKVDLGDAEYRLNMSA
jgi:hypothetical protein